MTAVDNGVPAPRKGKTFCGTEKFHQRQGRRKLLSAEKTELCIYA